jgi:hypothetical protein
MIPMTATKEELIRALTQKMRSAFAENRHSLFNRLADERLRLLGSLDKGPALSDKLRKLLREIAMEDRAWLDTARRKKDTLRVEIDRLRGRQSALQHLSRAYRKTAPQAQFFSRPG